METIKRRQRLLRFLQGKDGQFYYDGPIDGIDGSGTQEGAQKFLKDYGFTVEAVTGESAERPDVLAVDANTIMVFSLATHGGDYVSSHFRVREFACNDGSDVVLIHPVLPVLAEAAREINGPFSPNSAYRTVIYNASIGGASLSRHCHGIAMDIPAKNATPQKLYDFFEEILGESGGLGLYSWGVHVDCRAVKSRWKE